MFHFGEIVVLFITGHASIHAIFYQGKYILYTKTNMLVIYKSQCLHCTVQYSTVQYSTVQYSTVQYSTVQYSTVQYSTVQYSTVQYSTVTGEETGIRGWLTPYSTLCELLMFEVNVKTSQRGEGEDQLRFWALIPRIFWELHSKVYFYDKNILWVLIPRKIKTI